MNSVSITEEPVSIVVSDNGRTTVVETTNVAVVSAITQGPQGPVGPSGLVVDQTAKVDKSLVYYDAAAATFKADATWTTKTIVDAGNF